MITIEFNDFMLFDFGFIMPNVNGAFFSIFLEPFWYGVDNKVGYDQISELLYEMVYFFIEQWSK